MFGFSSCMHLSVAIFGIFLSLLLSGCQSVQPQEQLIVEVPAAPVPAVLTEQQKHIKSILAEADYCLSQNKLLNPINDNAHDRYRSVLLMDPANEHAKLGLHTIAEHYLEMARTAAARGNVREAQAMMRNAQEIDNDAAVQDAAFTLRKQIASIPPSKPFQAGANEHLIDTKLLKSKDAQVMAQLGGVVKKLKDSGDFALIVAPSDADGRMIYQELRNVASGFLVRGDIKIGSPARVKIVKSLE